MNSKGLRVLIIDDELQIRKMLRVALAAHGYEIQEAQTGAEGISQAVMMRPEVIILDLGLPDIDGKDVVSQMREWTVVPIIVLSARDQEEEKIAALDAGADDYITKPFSIGELMARMRVSLRRVAQSEQEPIIHCGDLMIDLTAHRVTVAGQEVKLTPTEYELLKELARHAGRVLTHKQLLKAVWGNVYHDDTSAVRVYIGQLRRKIESNPAQPRYIITESGVGYRLMC